MRIFILALLTLASMSSFAKDKNVSEKNLTCTIKEKLRKEPGIQEVVLGKDEVTFESDKIGSLVVTSTEYIGFAYLPPIGQAFIDLVNIKTGQVARSTVIGTSKDSFDVSATLGVIDIPLTERAGYPMLASGMIEFDCELTLK